MNGLDGGEEKLEEDSVDPEVFVHVVVAADCVFWNFVQASPVEFVKPLTRLQSSLPLPPVLESG